MPQRHLGLCMEASIFIIQAPFGQGDEPQQNPGGGRQLVLTQRGRAEGGCGERFLERDLVGRIQTPVGYAVSYWDAIITQLIC